MVIAEDGPADLTRKIKNVFISYKDGFNVSEITQRFITNDREDITNRIKGLLKEGYLKETDATRPGNTGPEVVLKHFRFVDEQ